MIFSVFNTVINFPGKALHTAVDRAVYHFTEPTKPFSPSEVTNLKRLKRRLKRGDVVLICGNARISSVVKVLTHSPWSHVVLYVGDKQELLTADEIKYWSARFGQASLQHLVIDADPVRRVHLRPLDDFAGLIVRQCRAQALTDKDCHLVLRNALSQLGREYDIKHIIWLLLFFAFPWGILPENMRRLVTDFTLSEDDRICSRVLAEAFHSVGYPIRPLRIQHRRGSIGEKALGVAFGLRRRSRTAARLLAGGRARLALSRLTDRRYTEIHLRGTRHITPADYDLSRFFQIIKDEEDLSIRYRDAKAFSALPERPK